MTKKRPVLPASGGSYVRKGSELRQVVEPTKELTRRDMEKVASTAVKDPVEGSDKETDQ
ncbi:hypothetical protein JQX09_22430 [Sulfitobacter pseudonitzschiae]|uniref:Uncharacterized protein n=1 Tax=Pseudosulfitobacter pseudonitzschiae TaxID=1402135 RepID=A0A9Q2P6K6_9RHOB|nr:hypothetical protein [Pseudosulfitobacter pseudonitzschiae]MBM2294706.1 hypothetical protein [Pseudosulfitobacter pseudonitzschiae]MBM2299643.1 hypothetical protein [Pseudosulfitobacter pseudonitzschiae]MBM2304520.1 hypothetical protein [Pseudosulfitobacter pseudonitzschiae]MBM2314317.1 hypothetical protein [Pseudosulfitobacter pseudonitzschiae]MBM2319211.1 hypothetical protein [Pseudosulfitobacter pseudonitzschiae]